MTKTEGKYTYKDLLLRKRILKQEIQEMEEMVTLPKTLGFIGGNLKGKTMEFVKNPATSGLLPTLLSFALDTGVGFGVEKIVSKLSGKQGPLRKIALLASGYIIPFVVNKSKELIDKKIASKNRVKKIE